MHTLMLGSSCRDKKLLKDCCLHFCKQQSYLVLDRTYFQSQIESQSPTKGYNVFIVATPTAPTMRSTDEKLLLLQGLWVETL